jgi:plastocyanin
MYVAALSAMVVLVFAVIAWAQDGSKEQGGSDPAGSADQAQSSTPSSKQETTPSSEQAAPSAQDAATVSILANAFDPPQLDVALGSTVTFVNEDAVAHTVALEGLFDSYEIAPGSTYPVWLGGGSGTVAYHDKANPEMRGTITVGGASQGGAATPTEPAGEEASQTGSEPTQTGNEDSQTGEDSQTDEDSQTGGEPQQEAADVSTEQNQDSA